MHDQKAQEVIVALRKNTKKFTPPLIDLLIKEFGHNPFIILIGCLLSLRAKDITTIHVCRSLFKIAKTPEQLLAIPRENLEDLLFPIGFYKNKSKTLQHVCQVIIEQFGGKVPQTEEELLSIKGVGRKTATLVLGLAFGVPAICVDTHVHRISNRLGFIKTKTPVETEAALKELLPKEYWIEWNKLIVMWGQNVCVPISPFCSLCAIRPYCKRVGVKKSR